MASILRCMIIRTVSASRARAEASKLEFGSLADHVPRQLEWLHEQRVTTADGKRVTVASIKERIVFWKITAMKAAFPPSSKAAEILLGIHGTTAERNS